METVLLCPPSVVGNFAVAFRDMNAVLLEKQQRLARAEKAPLELPPSPPQSNARDFPTSRKKEVTGLEAALQGESDATVRCRQEIRQAKEDGNLRKRYREGATACILACHNQQQPSAPPSPSPTPSLSAPPPLFNPPHLILSFSA